MLTKKKALEVLTMITEDDAMIFDYNLNTFELVSRYFSSPDKANLLLARILRLILEQENT